LCRLDAASVRDRVGIGRPRAPAGATGDCGLPQWAAEGLDSTSYASVKSSPLEPLCVILRRLDIYMLGTGQAGIAQGRMYQLAAYLLTLSIFVIGVAVLLNWRNSAHGFWLNLCVAGWADGIWVLVVVLPGYVGWVRGFLPPAIFLGAAVLTMLARRRRTLVQVPDP
jgi:hypothetical protein